MYTNPNSNYAGHTTMKAFSLAPPLQSAVDRHADSYTTNYAAMQSAIERLHGELAKSRVGGGPKYNERHTKRGKLLPRDRVELLLDEHSYFLEIAPLAGIGIDDEFPGARVLHKITSKRGSHGQQTRRDFDCLTELTHEFTASRYGDE